MNLIDFHVTKVLSNPEKKTSESGKEYWLTEVEYWDDGGSGQKMKVMTFSEDQAKMVVAGYVGQH